jgi:hypothetical protein
VIIPLRLFQIFTKIRGDIRNFVFIPGVNDTGDKLSQVSLLPTIALSTDFHRFHDTGDQLITGNNDIANDKLHLKVSIK